MLFWSEVLVLLVAFPAQCAAGRAAELNQLGLEKCAVQDFGGAASRFRAGLSESPECEILRINLALACLHGGCFEEARAELEQVEKRHLNDPYSQYLLGVLRMREGQRNEARRHFQEVAQIDPADAAVWRQLGMLELQSGDKVLARRLFERALSLDPSDSSTLYNLARLLLQGGDTMEGQALLERFRQRKREHPSRLMGGMGEPVTIPGKYARFRRLTGEAVPTAASDGARFCTPARPGS